MFVQVLADALSDSWFIFTRQDLWSHHRPYEIDVLVMHEKCGVEWVNAGDDPADRLDVPTVDNTEFNNDPDMIENDEFDDLGDEVESE